MAAPVYPAQNQWLLSEDEAFKDLLSGISVPNDRGQLKSVPVWFRFPEQERQIIYPFITIDLIGLEPAYDLWTSTFWQDEDAFVFEDEFTGEPDHFGLYEPSVAESIFDVPPGLDPSKPVRRLNYLPYRLFYQISTWSKTFAHDRLMTGALIRDIIHPRPCWLRVEADKTWRRMEPLGWSAADLATQEGGIKRIFRKVFTVSVQSELAQDRLPFIEQRVAVGKVLLRGEFKDLPGSYWTEDESTEFWEQIQP